jgi:hypothetical protein
MYRFAEVFVLRDLATKKHPFVICHFSTPCVVMDHFRTAPCSDRAVHCPCMLVTPARLLRRRLAALQVHSMDKGGHFAAAEEPHLLHLSFKKFVDSLQPSVMQ